MKLKLTWTLIFRNEAANGNLERVVASIRKATPSAKIYAVEGGPSSDESFELAQKLCDRVETYLGPKGDWTKEMLAFTDAAAARNRCIDMAIEDGADLIAWADCDDTIETGATARKILDANAQWEPGGSRKIEGEGEEISLEDLLDEAFTTEPRIGALVSPYAYRAENFDEMEKGENYICVTWQDRRRIARAKDFYFIREGHEDLVSRSWDVLKSDGGAPMGRLPHVVWLHHKRFTNEDMQYSLDRHFDILWAKWQAGTTNFRDDQYLLDFTRLKAPMERHKVYDHAYEIAGTPPERYVVHMSLAEDAANDGFWLDAEEHWGACYELQKERPEAPLMAGRHFMKAREWHKAQKWYERGLAGFWNGLETLVSPRYFHVEAKAEYAMVCIRLGDAALTHGRSDYAFEHFMKAEKAFTEIRENPASKATEVDADQAEELWAYAKQRREATQMVIAYKKMVKFLLDNDEGEKVLTLLDSLPYMLKDLGEIRELYKVQGRLKAHLTDPEVYRQRYADDEKEFFSENKELILAPRFRTSIVIDDIMQRLPQGAIVLDVGAFDGPLSVPLLQRRPDLNYIAYEGNPEACTHLNKNLAEKVPQAKHIRVYAEYVTGETKLPEVDAVLCTEVIEHVPEPVEFLKNLQRALKPNGVLYISTPTGSIDRGERWAKNATIGDKREGFREHIRALSVRDLHEMLLEAGYDPLQHITSVVSPQGQTQIAVAQKLTMKNQDLPEIVFVAPSQHWPWNATKVVTEGIGASEECIVYLARELAKTRQVSVYTRIPEHFDQQCETIDGVSYWPLEQLWRVKPGCIVINSRCPWFDPEELQGKAKKTILWLQDTIYQELSDPKVQARYDEVVTVSPWHLELIHENNKVPRAKLTSISNFLLREHFPLEEWPERKPHRFIYASSPDRGLITLMEMWPEILKEWPDAELHVCYGWDGMISLGLTDPSWVARHRYMRSHWMKHKTQKGIVDHGRLNHVNLANLMRTCSAWLYPNGTFCETNCNSGNKMRAAGVVPVTTSVAGLLYSAESPWTQRVENGENYVERFLEGIRGAVAVSEENRRTMARTAVEEECLEARMEPWLVVIDGEEDDSMLAEFEKVVDVEAPTRMEGNGALADSDDYGVL